MKAIQKELGEADERTQEIEALRRGSSAGMPEEAKGEALRELDRLAKMPPAAAEYPSPGPTSTARLHAMAAGDDRQRRYRGRQAVLDADHEGLEKVKDRILEYLAVKKIRPSARIRSFASWARGVGKTSSAIDRAGARAQVPPDFARRHARRGRDPWPPAPYIGALPARSLRAPPRWHAEPVFMLDEMTSSAWTPW